LLQTVINKTVEELGEEGLDSLDAIIVSGDLVQHGIEPSKVNITFREKFELLQDLIRISMREISRAFPDTPCLVVYGNNDFI